MPDFLFDLPSEQIARYPSSVRSHSRLMHIDPGNDEYGHLRFDALPDLLDSGDLLVFNSSRVVPARLALRKQSGGKVEMLMERVVDSHRALALLKSNKPLADGAILQLVDCQQVTVVIAGRSDQFFVLELLCEQDWYSLLDSHGRVPLPPYLGRQDEEIDRLRYQTVYADVPGSVAAPTAGLHFDHAVFARLRERGVDCAWLQLHVGYGTFAPVRDANADRLHSERFSIDQECCDRIVQCREAGNRVVAVGTTTCRVLEHLALSQSFHAQQGETRLFIKPGFSFRCVDALLTNFHLPGSSLLYLVAAFAGEQRIMDAYQSAVKNGYRFYSYGDAMLIDSPGQ